jgi:mono/diheme cytochrome c family protein
MRFARDGEAMRHSHPIAAFTAVLLIALPVAAQTTAPAGGDVQHGHQLFLADGCSQCHGTVGQGGAAGPRIAPDPIPAEAIAGYIRDPSGEMPPYSVQVLDDRGIADIQAYLASLPQPPALSAIPLLHQEDTTTAQPP